MFIYRFQVVINLIVEMIDLVSILIFYRITLHLNSLYIVRVIWDFNFIII
jgi:hypothetical protein